MQDTKPMSSKLSLFKLSVGMLFASMVLVLASLSLLMWIVVFRNTVWSKQVVSESLLLIDRNENSIARIDNDISEGIIHIKDRTGAWQSYRIALSPITGGPSTTK